MKWINVRFKSGQTGRISIGHNNENVDKLTEKKICTNQWRTNKKYTHRTSPATKQSTNNAHTLAKPFFFHRQERYAFDISYTFFSCVSYLLLPSSVRCAFVSVYRLYFFLFSSLWNYERKRKNIFVNIYTHKYQTMESNDRLKNPNQPKTVPVSSLVIFGSGFWPFNRRTKIQREKNMADQLCHCSFCCCSPCVYHRLRWGKKTKYDQNAIWTSIMNLSNGEKDQSDKIKRQMCRCPNSFCIRSESLNHECKII